MSALADQWELDPDALTAAALEAPRCECPEPLIDAQDDFPDCQICGREIRAPGTMSREFRRAAYERRLRWARGAGVDPRSGFRGLRGEVGPNPELPTLDAALSARVDELAPVTGDPFAGDLAELMVAA